MSKSVHIKTFGCQMNVYDADRMLALLAKAGYTHEAELRKADVILINTCSIRDKAEHKVLSLLGELKPLKDANPDRVIGIAGCVGQRMGRSLLQRVPHLDLVFGPDSVDRVVKLVGDVIEKGDRIVEAKFDEDAGREYSQPAVPSAARPSEYMTIMKGCDHYCTYCIVPFVRGKEKSRPIPEILDGVRQLVDRGTKEITYLGQNINTYGKGTPWTLADLIAQTNAIPGLERIRYITSHPRDLGDDLIAQFGTVEKLCPNLHLPFQSGSDAVLKRMSRLYTRDEYLRKVDKLKAARPDIGMTADVIIGFPGETDADFEETMKVIQAIDFTILYLFKYSPRPGTRAYAYGEEVPAAVVDERFQRARELSLGRVGADNRALIGKTVPVLIEAMDRKDKYYSGRTPQNKLTHVLNAGDACLGKVLDVEITHGSSTSLRGYYVGAPRVDKALAFATPAPLPEVAHAL